jgi:hypothetical protein
MKRGQLHDRSRIQNDMPPPKAGLSMTGTYMPMMGSAVLNF